MGGQRRHRDWHHCGPHQGPRLQKRLHLGWLPQDLGSSSGSGRDAGEDWRSRVSGHGLRCGPCGTRSSRLRPMDRQGQRQVLSRHLCDTMKDDITGDKLYQRADDTAEALKKRLDGYQNQTVPILDHYAPKGIVKRVNGGAQIDEVWAEVKRKLANGVQE